MLQGASVCTECPPRQFRPLQRKLMFHSHQTLRHRNIRHRKHAGLHAVVVFFFLALHTILPPFSQGVPVELLCRPTSAGFDLDVCCARHDRQALHPLSDPLCRLWLAAGFCHCDGALYPTERGRGWLEFFFFPPTTFVYSRTFRTVLVFLFSIKLSLKTKALMSFKTL